MADKYKEDSEKTEDCFEYIVNRDPAITLLDFYQKRHFFETNCRDGISSSTTEKIKQLKKIKIL